MRFATGTKRPPVAAFRCYQPEPLRSILTQFKPPRHAGFHVLKLVLQSLFDEICGFAPGLERPLAAAFSSLERYSDRLDLWPVRLFPLGGFHVYILFRTHSTDPLQVSKLAIIKIKTANFETSNFQNKNCQF